jgi:hypothetical protein
LTAISGRSKAAITHGEDNAHEGSGPSQAPQNGAPETATRVDPPAVSVAPPPVEVLRPLTIGSVVGQGWRIANLSGVEDGSCVLTLANERGREYRVHVCSNDGRPQGLVYTKRFDLVVMNGGQGDLPTEEGFAQAVAEVAHALAANEHALENPSLVAELKSHEERVRLYTGPADRKLL